MNASSRIHSLVLGLCLATSGLGATDLRVPQDYAAIQLAIQAAVDGDRVLVSPGTYSEQINFLGRNISVLGVSGPSVTTLDGSAGAPVVTLTAGETRAALLEGFTITNAVNVGNGGAILMSSSATIRGNVIRGNIACSGAGIGVFAAGVPLIERNLIADNSNSCTGGAGGAGIHLFAAQVEIRENQFLRNHTGLGASGAAIFLNSGGQSVISRNLIAENVAEGGYGGAIGLVNSTTAVVEQNLMVRNSAGFYGGAVYLLTGPVTAVFSNNTILENTALSGSAVYVEGYGVGPVFYNNLMSGPPAVPLIRCHPFTVLLPEMIRNLRFVEGAPVVDGTCSEAAGSFGNLSVDPRVGGDYSLSSESPAIDAGYPHPPGVGLLDFAGRPRVVDGDLDGVATIDLGALERQPSVLEIPVLGTGGLLALAALLAAAALARLRA